jgi:hypothetical protein
MQSVEKMKEVIDANNRQNKIQSISKGLHFMIAKLFCYKIQIKIHLAFFTIDGFVGIFVSFEKFIPSFNRL